MSTAIATRTLQVTRSFAATPERVFDAWLDPAIAPRFLFATSTGEMLRVEIDARVDGKFLIVRRDNGEDIEHVGEYLTIDRPRRLVFTFAVPKFSAQATQVTVEIAPAANGCTLTLMHEGVLPEWAERAQDGWGKILAGLDDTIQQQYAILLAPDTILLERLLPGPIERVWEYLTDPEKLSTWLGVANIEQRAGTFLRVSGSEVLECRFGCFLQFFWTHLLDCLPRRPRMPEWICELTIAITPELVFQRHRHLGAGR